MYGGKSGTRAWKGFNWDTLDRLYEKGLIGDPKSVPVTEEGIEVCEKLFREKFGMDQEEGG